MTRNKIFAVLAAAFLTMNLISCGGDPAGGLVAESNGAGSESPLLSISITPDNPQIANETQQQFTATGIYADNTTRDLTAEVTWSSSDPEIAANAEEPGSFSDTTATGLTAAPLTSSLDATDIQTIHVWRVQGKKYGRTKIRAHHGRVQGTTSITVSDAKLVSLAITPVNPHLAKGTKLQFTATGTFSDNTTQDMTASATWRSSNPAAATVGNATGSKGQAAGVAPGSTTVTAVWKNISASTTLTVTSAALASITVTPSNPNIAKGTKQQFIATGTYTDKSTQTLTSAVIWSSSDNGIATVSNTAGSKGLAASLAAGSTTITAALGGVSGSTTLTVSSSTLLSVSVTPIEPTLANGTDQQFTATGIFSDDTTQDLTASATWFSSNTSVAAISNAAGLKGMASTVAAGSTTITAIAGGVSGSTTLTVTAATLESLEVSPVDQSIADGTTQQFSATGTYTDGSTQDLTAEVTWSSSNAAVASISNASGSKGMVITLRAGTVTITATSGGVSVSTTLTVNPAVLVSIDVTPLNPGIVTGAQQQFSATGTYSDGSTQNLTAAVTWTSSNTGVATISNASGSKGLAASVAAGSTTITADLGSVSGSATLNVAAAPVTGSATLTWNAPTTRTDGTPLTNLSGYKIHYGTSSGNYTNSVNVGNVTAYTLNNLTLGTYYFSVTALDGSGNESAYSNEGSKAIY